MTERINTNKIGGVRHININDFDISLDDYNNWPLNPTGELQVTPTLVRVFYLDKYDGSVKDINAAIALDISNRPDYTTLEFQEDGNYNAEDYPRGTYYYDPKTQKWEVTESDYSIYKLYNMFNSLAYNALIDVTGVAENLAYLDPKTQLTPAQYEYARDMIRYQVYHIVNNGLEENENDFQMSAGIQVQQGENTKQLIWEGLHSKVLTLLDISKIQEIDINFDEDGNITALRPINIFVKGITTEKALPTNAKYNDAWWVDGYLFIWNGNKWVKSNNLTGPIGQIGPIGPSGRDGFVETKGAFRDIDGTIHNKLYFVLDMDGVDGFTNNEKGFVYVDSTGTIEYAKTWSGIKQFVNSQILLVNGNINIIEEDLDKITDKVDDVISDVNDLAEQVQYIENTWTGSQGFGGTNPAEPEIDLKTLTGNKGAFDFIAGKKMLVKITLNNTLYSAEKLMRVADHSSFHIVGRDANGGATTDITFTLSLNTNGILKMTDFHSSGTANHNAFFLRLELVEQNPKITAVIDAYTKAESDAKHSSLDLSNSTAIKYYKGQILEFNEVKTGTKFEDTTLFTKHIIKDGYAIVGGTDGSETTGQNKSHSHRLLSYSDSQGDYIYNWNAKHNTSPAFSFGAYAYQDHNPDGTKYIDSEGGPANLAAGIKLLKVAYVAKKDISFNEMV